MGTIPGRAERASFTYTNLIVPSRTGLIVGVVEIAVLSLAVIVASCDQAPQASDTGGTRPLVSTLTIAPDSVNAVDLRSNQVEDSLAKIPLDIEARVTDPDGTVERVVFTIEPSTNPQGTASGALSSRGEAVYGRRVVIRVPVFLSEVYTVRVFAVDDDSLASNQGLGQFRFVAEDEAKKRDA